MSGPCSDCDELTCSEDAYSGSESSSEQYSDYSDKPRSRRKRSWSSNDDYSEASESGSYRSRRSRSRSSSESSEESDRSSINRKKKYNSRRKRNASYSGSENDNYISDESNSSSKTKDRKKKDKQKKGSDEEEDQFMDNINLLLTKDTNELNEEMTKTSAVEEDLTGKDKKKNSVQLINGEDQEEAEGEEEPVKASYHSHSHHHRKKHEKKQYLGDPKDPEYTSRTYHGMRMSKITMPTGKVFEITVPVKSSSGWHCKKKKSDRIVLNRHGRVSRREWQIVTKEVEKTRVQQRFGNFTKFDFIKVEKLQNSCLWKRYRRRRRDIMRDATNPNDRMLFHGSTHVMELADAGFDERYANYDGMFGAGLYFASNSSKSNLYVFGLGNGNKCQPHQDGNCDKCERTLLLCRVTLGNIKEHTTAYKYAHPPIGFHSVKGVKGSTLLTDEYVVYRGEQVYPEYLITYKIVK